MRKELLPYTVMLVCIVIVIAAFYKGKPEYGCVHSIGTTPMNSEIISTSNGQIRYKNLSDSQEYITSIYFVVVGGEACDN